MTKLLTKEEIEVLLFLLDDLDNGDPLKHHDDPPRAYDVAEQARVKLRRALKRRS